MQLPNHKRLATILADRFGLSLKVDLEKTPEGVYVGMRPTDLDVNEGFVIRTNLGWRHVKAQLQIETFAADLLKHMASANSEQKGQFKALAHLALAQGGRVTMVINGTQVDPNIPDTWPAQWRTIDLQLERTPVMVDHDDTAMLEETTVSWGGNLLGMVVSLLPIEQVDSDAPLEIRGLPEGARERVEVNRYERSRINRMLCIALHGTSCRVCDFSFLRVYGELGREFIHIHHVVPVSKLGPKYVIDPELDLVPVCPNCHAMLHRQDPPLTVAQLREHLQANS